MRSAPLWSEDPPQSIAIATRIFLNLWSRDPATWDFWRRWWEGARDGRPLDWELQRRVALIPPEEWEKNDPARIAELIREIETDFALERTDNAERIEVNPATGRLRLVPTSALPADIAAMARINIAAALDLFGPLTQDQYRALDPARTRLRGVLEQAPEMPMVLFDACRSAVRITLGYAATQSIPAPEQDPLIAEFLRILRETGADIAGHDPQTRDVLSRRELLRDDAVLIAHRETILPLVEAVAGASEGELALSLPEDADRATDPAADPEVRRDSAFRLAGRMVRVGVVTGVLGPGAVGAAIAGAREIAGLAAHPAWQVFLKAVWRFLGMG